MSTPLPEKISHVLESCLYAADLAAAERFYADVLGLVLHGKQPGRHVFFRCGEQMVLLFNPVESSQPGTHGGLDVPLHGTTGAGHLCFAVHEADLPTWLEHLARHNVLIEKVLDWPGGGRSLYFRDPAGNSLELATPKIWQIAEASLTSGNDAGTVGVLAPASIS
jgi:catechol 2,3-dioxygenase-like lactoylglutathione lyase family enzyme